MVVKRTEKETWGVLYLVLGGGFLRFHILYSLLCMSDTITERVK